MEVDSISPCAMRPCPISTRQTELVASWGWRWGNGNEQGGDRARLQGHANDKRRSSLFLFPLTTADDSNAHVNAGPGLTVEQDEDDAPGGRVQGRRPADQRQPSRSRRRWWPLFRRPVGGTRIGHVTDSGIEGGFQRGMNAHRSRAQKFAARKKCRKWKWSATLYRGTTGFWNNFTHF